MCFWLVILGAWMGWIETVYSKPAEKQLTATDVPLPEIPPMYRAEPAVLEAGRIIRGRSIAYFIPDGRVVQ